MTVFFKLCVILVRLLIEYYIRERERTLKEEEYKRHYERRGVSEKIKTNKKNL